jgi:hypothetical protein
MMSLLLKVLKFKVKTFEMDQFRGKAQSVQQWLYLSRNLILENRRKLNLKFTNLGLVDCGAMTLFASTSPNDVHSKITQVLPKHEMLCELLRAAESECYLGLVRYTSEFAYLQELEKLSNRWVAIYRSLTENKAKQGDGKSSFHQFRQGFVMQLESLQAENAENFPVPEEMSQNLAALSKSNKWLLRYENLLL